MANSIMAEEKRDFQVEVQAINNIIEEGKRVFEVEVKAINKMKETLDTNFELVVKLIANCKGKVITTGIGKPGHISAKIAATMSSLGISSFFLHPAEALHGDLGVLSKDDIIIAISYSGESEEIARLISSVKSIGATLIAISGNKDSKLVRNSDYHIIFPEFSEACLMGLAPTSSTTVALVLGDALAISASKEKGFKEKNYALYHPAGSLGKKLLMKVSDIMHKGDRNATVLTGTTLKDAIIEMSSKAIGIINILNEHDELVAVFTDGDLRRSLANGINVYEVLIDDVMTKSPISTDPNMLAIDALKMLTEKNISALPVVSNNKLVGTIRINDIFEAGIVL